METALVPSHSHVESADFSPSLAGGGEDSASTAQGQPVAPSGHREGEDPTLPGSQSQKAYEAAASRPGGRRAQAWTGGPWRYLTPMHSVEHLPGPLAPTQLLLQPIWVWARFVYSSESETTARGTGFSSRPLLKPGVEAEDRQLQLSCLMEGRFPGSHSLRGPPWGQPLILILLMALLLVVTMTEGDVHCTGGSAVALKWRLALSSPKMMY